ERTDLEVRRSAIRWRGEVHRSTNRSKKKTAKKRHNTGRPEATDGDKLRNCNIEEKKDL
ncbi:hypothetical protein L9F63_001097, partial [Diploptera punctata]